MKRKYLKALWMACLIGGWIMPSISARGFALLGPYEDWMGPTNGFNRTVDYYYGGQGPIGGPMEISNEYRWNVPVITYGFDQSFLDFFGTNGVAAVESAIQILNDLPPASEIVPANYTNYSPAINYQAQAQQLSDLKSTTLSLLLEQLGLGTPSRWDYVLRSWDPIFESSDPGTVWPDGFEPYTVVTRNFDPTNFNVTGIVNGLDVDWGIWTAFPQGVDLAEIIVVPYYSPPLGDLPYSTVADKQPIFGLYYTALTVDDVGGLSYLYSSDNINYETLLPNVSGAGTNLISWVNGAWRPGVNKIRFLKQPCGSSVGRFEPMTNEYIDTYISKGIVARQQLQRVVNQPDILFSCGDTSPNNPLSLPYIRTGTSNWINNSTLNGNSEGAGPGVITPGIKITFANTFRSSDEFQGEVYDSMSPWATYDQSTNAPIVYPIAKSGPSHLTVRFWLSYQYLNESLSPTGYKIDLSVSAPAGKAFLLQSSPDLIDWTSIGTNQVDGSLWEFFNHRPIDAQQFYRMVPQ